MVAVVEPGRGDADPVAFDPPVADVFDDVFDDVLDDVLDEPDEQPAATNSSPSTIARGPRRRVRTTWRER